MEKIIYMGILILATAIPMGKFANRWKLEPKHWMTYYLSGYVQACILIKFILNK